MPTIADIRKQYPQYDDLSDEQIADALHQRYYSDMPREEFNSKVGVGKKKVTSFGSEAEQRDRWAANHPIASKAAKFLQGLPFVGEYVDEAFGAVTGDQENTRLVRAMQDREARENPKTSMGLQIGGALTTLPLMGGGVSALNSIPSLGGRMVAGGLAGGGLGALEGGVSGYGAGTDDQSRIDEAKNRAAIGSLLGAGIGAAVPAVGAGAKSAYNKVIDTLSLDKRAREAGLSRPSYQMLSRAMEADGSLSGQGARNLMRAGDDAMLADAGPNAQMLLDTATQRSGKASNIARTAIEDRASGARQTLTNAMDDAFGRTPSYKARPTRPNLDPAYRAAYSKPIDYSDPLAMEIEDIVKRRVPRSAITKANELMRAEGEASRQILAKVDDAGNVVFERLPDVRQLDYLTRGLNEVADRANGQGKLGGTTQTGRAYANLSREIRDRLKKLVPEYRAALGQSSQAIGEKEARDFGETLLSSRVTRSDAYEMIRDMGEAELAKLKQGVRVSVDDAMANVQRAIQDGNMDAREAVKVLRDMSSRSAREKVGMVLGRAETDRLFKEIDRATMAMQLRASVAQNSKTFARQNMDDMIRSQTSDGVVNALRSGEAVNAPKRMVAALLGRSEADKAAIADATYEEIVTALTQLRGQSAQRALQTLEDISRKLPQNEALARALADYSAGAVAIPAYQTGTRGSTGLR